MFFVYDPTMLILIPAIIFTLYAQGKVKRAYSKFSGIPVRSGVTGQQTARRILDSNGMGHVPIEVISGQLTDNYDPTNDVMHLSNGICYGNSIASVAVAAHESGHAIQDGSNYGFLRFRIAMVPAVNFVSGASWPLIILGLIIGCAGNSIGSIIFDLGVIMFLIVVLFHTVTLPVEINASRRALKQLTNLGIVDDYEIKGAKKVLSAAAMTYVAALATSVLNLVRILMIRNNSN